MYTDLHLFFTSICMQIIQDMYVLIWAEALSWTGQGGHPFHPPSGPDLSLDGVIVQYMQIAKYKCCLSILKKKNLISRPDASHASCTHTFLRPPNSLIEPCSSQNYLQINRSSTVSETLFMFTQRGREMRETRRGGRNARDVEYITIIS
jgi:hypothetical protein